MSIKQLRAFHVVALCGGFSRAAREISIGQSTLSSQVRQLEALSGVRLFERKQRGVVLTPEGQTLFEVTRRLFAAESEARAFLRCDVRRAGGHLRLAADGAFHPVQILTNLQRDRPQLTFTLSLGNSEQVIEHILNHRADVGITARLPADRRLHARPMLSMGIGVFVRADHDWAGRSSLAMKDLGGRPFVMRERGSVTREVFERNLAAHSVGVGPVLEASTPEGVRELVAGGFGLGIVADREFGYDSRLRFLPLTDARILIEEYTVCLDERRRLPLVRDFMACAESLFRPVESRITDNLTKEPQTAASTGSDSSPACQRKCTSTPANAPPCPSS
ncbi:LysR family transcriptional regulator [Bradyrhizobium sp. LHD-71]|uniref:LysR family transcriptional regulator n=1 Tax=Bradyrhizobium sp. LHD-71 TaxID=3072141 RepID=UPI00280F3141|nr:LysR family transcriptional regulator [Bradyrhizobium sp. LHD-71]MDQ8731496.1 LysR family transcriptional regulator [Bradyrhizobium sp. LHD-71]